ncbi:hypothetical protein M427DRAFT_502303 [Gonapodya prolifera JEL478]|uniref:Uncharacterized protein n=1 Tax=Gonapodya prolifera (strain JEL478) TaxID=1344416 RepID=A0A139A702_GONPJ|nr:hypothetical protein M427DRAFT_502303 [Gonapodya prolifera JEL478]|eukprot:KXS12494.1 hypothetical protein M427DRAFT_502303 [Gonapodya prolifera JEL478]
MAQCWQALLHRSQSLTLNYLNSEDQVNQSRFTDSWEWLNMSGFPWRNFIETAPFVLNLVIVQGNQVMGKWLHDNTTISNLVECNRDVVHEMDNQPVSKEQTNIVSATVVMSGVENLLLEQTVADVHRVMWQFYLLFGGIAGVATGPSAMLLGDSLVTSMSITAEDAFGRKTPTPPSQDGTGTPTLGSGGKDSRVKLRLPPPLKGYSHRVDAKMNVLTDPAAIYISWTKEEREVMSRVMEDAGRVEARPQEPHATLPFSLDVSKKLPKVKLDCIDLNNLSTSFKRFIATAESRLVPITVAEVVNLIPEYFLTPEMQESWHQHSHPGDFYPRDGTLLPDSVDAAIRWVMAMLYCDNKFCERRSRELNGNWDVAEDGSAVSIHTLFKRRGALAEEVCTYGNLLYIQSPPPPSVIEYEKLKAFQHGVGAANWAKIEERACLSGRFPITKHGDIAKFLYNITPQEGQKLGPKPRALGKPKDSSGGEPEWHLKRTDSQASLASSNGKGGGHLNAMKGSKRQRNDNGGSSSSGKEGGAKKVKFGSPTGQKFNGNCNYCGKQGHKSDVCRKRQRDQMDSGKRK